MLDSSNVCTSSVTLSERNVAIDEELSRRPLALDPSGYFIVYVDRERGLLCAKYFTNVIDERGLAVDPETGMPIPARSKTVREPEILFQGRTAKEVCVEIFERSQRRTVSMLNHAAYLGRELQKAEWAMLHQLDYIQD